MFNVDLRWENCKARGSKLSPRQSDKSPESPSCVKVTTWENQNAGKVSQGLSYQLQMLMPLPCTLLSVTSRHCIELGYLTMEYTTLLIHPRAPNTIHFHLYISMFLHDLSILLNRIVAMTQSPTLLCLVWAAKQLQHVIVLLNAKCWKQQDNAVLPWMTISCVWQCYFHVGQAESVLKVDLVEASFILTAPTCLMPHVLFTCFWSWRHSHANSLSDQHSVSETWTQAHIGQVGNLKMF